MKETMLPRHKKGNIENQKQKTWKHGHHEWDILVYYTHNNVMKTLMYSLKIKERKRLWDCTKNFSKECFFIFNNLDSNFIDSKNKSYFSCVYYSYNYFLKSFSFEVVSILFIFKNSLFKKKL